MSYTFKNYHYTVRQSQKAKYLQLRLSQRHGLQVIVPSKSKMSQNQIQAFIQQKESWIAKHWHQLGKANQLGGEQKDKLFLPATIHLAAINQIWRVKYNEVAGRKMLLMSNLSHEVTLLGDINNKTLCIIHLQDWLKTIAANHLSQALLQLSKTTGLLFQQMSIRNNQTRWGSCSSDGVISLCCKLLFLPPALMHHVILHELCHTKHMNHSKRFWQLLTKHDPLTETHIEQLKSVEACIPSWVSA